MRSHSNKSIKWINALDTVLIGKTKGNESKRNKIAAFDLVGYKWCFRKKFNLVCRMAH